MLLENNICGYVSKKQKSIPKLNQVSHHHPFMPAWTCTAHKVQGVSLTQIAVNVQLLNHRKVSYDQIYVQ